MNPNFFVADFKISAEEMGKIDDGETYFGSDSKDKNDSDLQSPLEPHKEAQIEHISVGCEAEKWVGEQAIIIPPDKEEKITHGELVNSDFYVTLCKSDMAATSSEEFRMVDPPSDEVQNSGVKNECSMKDEMLREYISSAPRLNEHLSCKLCC